MATNFWEKDAVVSEQDQWWKKDSVVGGKLTQGPSTPEQPKDQSAFRQVADVPLSLGRGALSGVRMIADAFGAGSRVSETIKGAEDYIAGLMSAQAKNDQQEIARIMKDAEDKGVADQVKAALKAFTVAPVDLISQGLGTAAPGILGVLGSNILGGGALAARLVGAGIGAGMGAGTIKGGIYEETKKALKDAGMEEAQAEARAQLAQSYGGENLDQILMGTAFGGLASATGIEKTVAGPLAKSILRRAAAKEAVEQAPKTGLRAIAGTAARGAAAEAAPEFLQAAQEQAAKNIALQREGFETPTMRGVVSSGLLEALAGAGLGAGFDATAAAKDTLRAKAKTDAERILAEEAAAAEPPAPVTPPPAQPAAQPEEGPSLEEIERRAGIATPPELLAEPVAEEPVAPEAAPVEEPTPPVAAAPVEEPAPVGEPTTPVAPAPVAEVAVEEEPGVPVREEIPAEFDRPRSIAEEMEGVPAPRLAEVEQEVAKLAEDQKAAVEERTKLEKRTAGTSLMQVLKGTLNDNELSELGGRGRKVGKNQFLNLKASKDRTGSSMEDMVDSGALDIFLPERMRSDHPDYVNSESAEYIREKLRSNQFYTYETELAIETLNRDIEAIERQIQDLLSDDEINKEIQDAVNEQRELAQADQELAPAEEAGAAAPSVGEEEILTPQTEEDLRAKAEREQKAARAEEEKRKEEDRKAAAPAPEDFVLTGSDRDADEAAARGQMDLTPAEEPAVAQVSPEEERKTALQGLNKSLSTDVPPFRARGGDGRVTITRPKSLSGVLTKEVYELAKDLLDLGLPASVLGNIKAAGQTRTKAVALVTNTGWLMVGGQWSSSSKAERLQAIAHELGHTVDTEGGAISKGAKWAKAHKELMSWYANSESKFTHPLAYPFAPQYRGKVRMEPESFAQAFGYYFTSPVDLQKNAPEAYSQIQQIIERIQDGSQRARAAGATTTGTAGIKIQPARAGASAEVQPEAREVGTAVSPTQRVQDRAAGQVRPIPLTSDERAYFDSVFQSPNDLADLQELAPSAQLTAEGLSVSPEDLSGLEDYVADTWAASKKSYGGEGAASIPRSFSSAGDRFIKKARQSLPDINMMQAPEKGRENILGEVTTGNWTLQPDTKQDTKDSLIYKFLDKNIDLKRVISAIKAGNQEILSRWNPYLKEELYHGRTADQTRLFRANEVAPLVEEMNKNGVTIGDFEQYLHNRHAEAYNKHVAKVNPNNPEMQDGGSGIKTEDAREYLANLPEDKRRVYEKLAERIDKITKGTRELLVNSGLEKRETIEQWEKTFPDYVPLMREEEDFEYTTNSFGVGQGFDVRGSFSKRAMGSKRNVVDILANAVLSRERAIVKAEKNRVAQAVYGLAIQNGNPNFWMAVNPMAEKIPQVALDDLARLNIGNDALEFLMKEPRQRAIDPKKNEVISRVNSTLRNSQYVLSMRLNGEDRYVFFNPNNERAKRAATALKNLDAQNLGEIMGFLGRITRFMAAMNTQYNPIFGAYNFLRDVQGAALQLSTTPLAGKQKEVGKYIAPSLKAIFQSLRKGKSTDTEMGKLWDDFRQAGGQTGFRDMYSRSQDREEALLDEFAKLSEGKVKKLGRATLQLLTDYNDTMENAVRLAAYKVALDSGMNKDEAASVAKNLTVNFNRKGDIAVQAGALYAFFNASMQGTARLIETLKGPLRKKIVYGGFLWGVIQSALLAMAGFDEEEPPEFVRERNIIIPIFGTDKYLAFPMPLGYHVIPGTSRAVTDAFMAIAGITKSSKTMAERMTDLTGMMLEAFNPIGNAGWSGQTLSPTPFDPIVALFENKDWTGKNIYKEDINKLKPTPGYTRAKETATWYSTQLAKFLNLASGGTKYQPGVINITPDQIDYLIGQIGGGVGREAAKIATTAERLYTGEELPPYKIPLVGRFYGETKSSAAEASRFYKNLEQLNKLDNEIKGRRENKESLEGFMTEHPEARLISRGHDIYSDIKKLRERKEKLVERNAPRESVKAVENLITAKQRQLNEQMDRLRK